jgi:hypothetical protein
MRRAADPIRCKDCGWDGAGSIEGRQPYRVAPVSWVNGRCALCRWLRLRR